ncbi:MAG: tetratricopeptide repeat protein, partial [Kiritimatiellia bacterium]|nr:tetratricopeptide repeat protein [Kiritimatiellia bacterium]
ALYRYDLGLAYARLGQHQKARRALASVVLEDPHLVRASSHLIPSAMVQLALTEGRLGSPLRGAGILQPALKPSIQVIYHLGRLSLQGDDPKTAIPLFEACVALQPEDEPSVHGLGTALLSAGRHAEALPHLRRAVRLDPACENAHYDLGVCFAALQKHRTARSCFKKALRLNPRHEGCHYGLACLDALENRPDAAFRNLEKSIAFGFGKPEYIRRDTDFRSLQKDRRWKPLLTGIRMKCGSAAVQDRRPGPVEPKSACFPEKGV